MGIGGVTQNSMGILENIFHNAKVGIAICSGKNYILEMVNPTFATIYGYEPSELIGSSSSKIFLPESMVKISALEDSQDELSFEAVHFKKDGMKVNVNIHITVLKNKDGVVNQRIVNIRDITEQMEAKRQLEDTQAKLKSIISTIPDMIWMKDRNGFYVACNDALERFFGKKEDELIGKTDYDFFPKENADICKLSDNEALKSNNINITQESFIYKEDGTTGILEIRKVPVLKEDGEVMGVLGIGRDITEQKMMESEILKQKNFQDTLLLGTAEAGVAIHVIENGRYIYTNDIKKAKKYGYDENILDVKPNFLDTIHPDDRAKAFDMYTRRMAGEDVAKNYELGVLQTDGIRKEHSVSVVPIPNTNPIQTIVVTQDITERKQMELQLKAREEAFSSLANNIPDNIARFDSDGCYLYINSTHERTLGMKLSEVIGRHYTEIIPSHSEALNALKRILTREQDEITVVQEFPNNNKVEIHEIKLLAEKNERNELVSILGIGRDITEKMRVEKELQLQSEQLFKSEKMVAMGEIIENIAHQWRQPLTVISIMTSGISIKQELGTLNDEELLSYTERILIQTEYLSKTIDDFRNFMKGEKEEKILNISSVFDKILSIVDSSLQANDIQLITHIDSSVEMKGYENELMQAFINIINNAKDALVENKILADKYIFIEVKSYNNQCEILIKDNGGGIKSSVITRIFEPYFTTKHKSQGTGLGLAMTYKIITEVHKGTITVSNETYEYIGKEYTGASFTIKFS